MKTKTSVVQEKSVGSFQVKYTLVRGYREVDLDVFIEGWVTQQGKPSKPPFVKLFFDDMYAVPIDNPVIELGSFENDEELQQVTLKEFKKCQETLKMILKVTVYKKGIKLLDEEVFSFNCHPSELKAVNVDYYVANYSDEESYIAKAKDILYDLISEEVQDLFQINKTQHQNKTCKELEGCFIRY